MRSFLVSMAFSVLFELLKDKNVAVEYRDALAKLYAQILKRSETDKLLDHAISEKVAKS